MTYAIGGPVQAADYNGFVSTNASNINSAWASGTASAGYGQPAFSSVAVGGIIYARPATVVAGNPPTWSSTPEWRALVDSINAMHRHQVGTNVVATADFNTPARAAASAVLPVAGTTTAGTITWASTLSAAIATVVSNQRLNAVAQRPTQTTSATSTIAWSQFLQTRFTINFGSHDQARWFFNAGGQIGFNASHPAGAVYDIDQLISDLCSDLGTIWISSTNGTPATVTLSGVPYAGVTQIGGGNPGGSTVNANNGFYALTAGSTTLVNQTSNFVYHAYGGTSFNISASYNGTGGLSFTCLIDQIPNGAVVTAGTVTNVLVKYPADTATGTGPLVNSWGTVTVTPTITGA